MASFNMMIPELPDYMREIGGGDYIGWHISVFTLAAFISRPLSGRLADRIGRIPVMILGCLVCILCGVVYPFFGTLFGFFVLRFVHGFSTGFKPTGTTAYLADIVPFDKRGEALGILGICGASGMALGHPLGSFLANLFGTDVMFYCSGLLALLSLLTLTNMKETLKDRETFKLSLLKIGRKDVYEPAVFPPSLIMVLTAFSFGIIITIIPDFAKHLGIENKGEVLFTFVVASLLIRLIAGKASDRFGRVPVLMVGTLILAVGMLLLGFATSAMHLHAAAFVVGMSGGINSPSIFAWTIDLSDPAHKARGMATMYMALELGIFLSGFTAGWVFNNDPTRFPHTFGMGSLLSLCAFIYLFIHHRRTTTGRNIGHTDH